MKKKEIEKINISSSVLQKRKEYFKMLCSLFFAIQILNENK